MEDFVFDDDNFEEDEDHFDSESPKYMEFRKQAIQYLITKLQVL